jgi:hypothetical protein
MGRIFVKPQVSVFIPVYNEEQILRDAILRIYKQIKLHLDNFEIFIVDDSSSDNTFDISSELSSKYPRIHYIRWENGPSRRENLARSFKRASGKIIVYVDIDMKFEPTFSRLVKEIHTGATIAIGSRYVKDAKIRRSWKRLFLSRMYNTFLKLYFGSRINDHQCGFKAFKRETLLDLVKVMGHGNRWRGWFWDAEILIRAQRRRCKIVEVPIEWADREDSSFDFGREVKMIPSILKLRFELGDES